MGKIIASIFNGIEGAVGKAAPALLAGGGAAAATHFGGNAILGRMAAEGVAAKTVHPAATVTVGVLAAGGTVAVQLTAGRHASVDLANAGRDIKRAQARAQKRPEQLEGTGITMDQLGELVQGMEMAEEAAKAAAEAEKKTGTDG